MNATLFFTHSKTGTTYMNRLSRAAHWMLPPDESAEVIADYRELVTQNPRPEEELYRELGNPVEAVRLLADESERKRWNRVFCILAFCLLIPSLSIRTPLWILFHDLFSLPVSGFHVDAADFLFPLGIGLSLWYWHGKQGNAPLSVPVRILLFILPLAAAGLLVWQYHLFGHIAPGDFLTKRGILPDGTIYEEYASWTATGAALANAWECLCCLSGAAGLLGLVRSRTAGFQWRALYLAGLTVSTLSDTAFRWLNALVHLRMPIEQFWAGYAVRCAAVTGIGIAAAVHAMRDGGGPC